MIETVFPPESFKLNERADGCEEVVALGSGGARGECWSVRYLDLRDLWNFGRHGYGG